MNNDTKLPGAVELENLWSGDFGDKYVERNAEAGAGRDGFWLPLLDRLKPQRVLEVGCNVGANLRWVAERIPHRDVFGIDINEAALSRIRGRFPGLNAVWTPARHLPFRDGHFDLAFSAGVLIHQPDASLPVVMNEMVRVSRRYVLTMEYFAAEQVEVPYREHRGALFKRDYGGLFAASYPELKLLERGELKADQGWDDVTFWLFEKTAI